MRLATTILLLLAAGATGFALRAADPDKSAKKADPRVFELRTYTVPEGKMDALHTRFRDITCKYFEKYGITVIGFWNPTDPKEAKTKLVYLLAHPSRALAAAGCNRARRPYSWGVSGRIGSATSKTMTVPSESNR